MNHHTLAFTAERLLDILRSFPGANAYVVGFSGGADSTALLHALAKIQDRLEIPVSAIHINHGLNERADQWQSECESFCHQYGIKLVCLKIALHKNSGKGLEAEARHMRYEAISGELAPGACLLTAHHANDQAETLLLNLMRGSGVDGLSAMPVSRPLGRGFLQRPLLGFQNSSLRDYLQQHGIEWSEDPSNQHIDHDRNFVRHEIIPALEQRWPAVSKRLLLTRKAMTDARYLLETLADAHLEEHLAHPYVLQLSSQAGEDPALFKLVVRYWVKQSGAGTIPAYSMESFYQQVQQADNDNKVTVRWDGWLLRLYKQKLWLHKDRGIPPCPSMTWSPAQPKIELGSEIGRLELIQDDGHPVPPTGELIVGNRSHFSDTGIKLRDHHKSIKNLFQEAGIPPWLRDSIPICQLDGELVTMGDWCLNGTFASWMSKNRIRLNWCPNNPLLRFILEQQHQ